MCCNSNLFYASYFKFLCNYFLKFIIHEINSKIVKSEIVVLIGRDKLDMADVDLGVTGCYKLLLECWWLREKADMT
jgi:hypothetical protein